MTENYINLLRSKYKNIDEVCTEIINLEAILSLPKGTEHFITDIHGEYEAFDYIRRSASGVLKHKIEDIFGDELDKKEQEELATLLFYPQEVLLHKKETEWYKKKLIHIIAICRVVASKYTRSKVRKAIPKQFAYIIEELISVKNDDLNKENYYGRIIDTVISLGRSNHFIIALCELIQRLSVDHLHIVGDIYDRGDEPHKILDDLANHHNVDIQWGNHDILWMGASMGQECLIANTLRISFRYSNFKILEDAYGINLLPLALFALKVYKDDSCIEFLPKKESAHRDGNLVAKMHKAISIIQFKLEGQLKKRNPQFLMKNMGALERIDFEKLAYIIDNEEYELSSTSFPTLDNENPFRLTEEEEVVMKGLKKSYLNSQKLHEHVKLLINKGSMYKVYNGNLLFHGCIPVDQDGSFLELDLDNSRYKGKELMDYFDNAVREAYRKRTQKNLDLLWYLWTGPLSPLFGKKHMATFERYLIVDKKLHKEEKNSYYRLREEEWFCKKILEEFGLNPDKSHIINGHTPILGPKGESPIKANGRLLCIDGGFSKGYQSQTGIAGYTLIYNSHGLRLATHRAFISKKYAIENSLDIIESIMVVEKNEREHVRDTDIGRRILREVDDLKKLLDYYKKNNE
jgi:fructose-1,6-bisphosphatase-3